jgi:hypothetical protein
MNNSLPTDEWINVRYIQNEILISYNEKWNVICRKMDGTGHNNVRQI